MEPVAVEVSFVREIVEDDFRQGHFTARLDCEVQMAGVHARLDLKEGLLAVAWHDRGPHFPRRIGHQVEDAPAPRLPVPDREHRGRAE